MTDLASAHALAERLEDLRDILTFEPDRAVLKQAAALLRRPTWQPIETVWTLLYPDGRINSIWQSREAAEREAEGDSKWRIESWAVGTLPAPPSSRPAPQEK